jgi:putative ABC transport system permease protein
MAQTPWMFLSYEDQQKLNRSFQYNMVDPDFVPTMGMKILEGRNFEAGNSADNAGTALVNETFVKTFNIKDPIGKKLPGPFPQQIIGVVRDFNFESLHTPIKPLILSQNPDSLVRHASDVSIIAPPQPRITVLLKGGNLADNIRILKDAWTAIAPTQDFDYHFLDERIAAQYAQDQRTNAIVRIASGISIFIACMGLFGLATLTVVKRVKEIGVRKVLGASVASIVRLLARDFIVLVLVASVIAAPIAWWAANHWLQDFSYHVSVEWWVFIAAGAGAMAVALITLSYQTIRAALASPVKNLRTE